MKITVRAEPSDSQRYFTYKLSDYDISDDEWESFTDQQRNEKLQEMLDGEPETPYWIVDRYDETYD